MRWSCRRGRGLVVLATAAVALPLTATLSPAAADTPAPAPVATPAPVAAVVPQPVSQQALPGGEFTLTAKTRIAVLSRDSAAVGVGTYLSKLLAPATGFDLQVVRTTKAPDKAVVLDPNGPKELGAEGYTVSARANGIVVTAYGAQGLFRGVQTLRQLLPAAVESRTKQSRAWTVASTEISDSPRYEYRGVMLDVARRFFPVEQVKRYIDEAAAYKINKLQLHLTDDQGWRIAIDALPNLTKVGASTQSGFTGGTGWYYTAADYKEIVSYAASRFMTVVPEIDGPGHTWAAQTSVPELRCDDKYARPYSGFDVKVSLFCLGEQKQMDATKNFLQTVIKAVAELTPGPYIHLGGDEVPDATTSEQYDSYVKTVSDATTAEKKTVMGWHQLGQSPLPAGSLLQYWGEDDDRKTIGTAKEALGIRHLRAGAAQDARFIMSPSDHAYLDMQYDASTPYGLKWSGFVPVQRSYEWDPATVTGKLDGTGVIVPAQKVAGVAAALWADRAYEGSNELPNAGTRWPAPQEYADFMSFPRLPAIAEVGWSPQSARDWNGFRQRLGLHGPRWTAAGIGFYPAPDVAWAGTAGIGLEGVHTLTTGGKALNVPGSSTASGTQLTTATADGGSGQKWSFTRYSDGTYALVNQASGLCADVNRGFTSAGAKIIQWTCTGTPNQRWIVTPVNGGHTITSAKTKLLLTAASTADGALITQRAAKGTALQKWTVE
ncbi:family 20 glycosylhydrolase [Kitasatospora sp. NPDC002965]|uniref:family 20 glycosylhydrolase n=1 Tax=Kitasatospora sp. NPDC002965 TaxID=3154775 RepID=UPI0033A7F8C0